MNKDEVRRSPEALTKILKEAGAVAAGRKTFKCWRHDDKKPSVSVFAGDDGFWRYRCHSCGSHGDYYDLQQEITGKDFKDLVPKEAPVKPKLVYPNKEAVLAAVRAWDGIRGIDDTYEYNNPETGTTDLLIVRALTDNGKTFKQFHWTGNGFAIGAPKQPWPIFNRKRVQEANTVIIVEGEKAAKRLILTLVKGGYDKITATTSPCGAGKGSYADWSPLSGKKIIYWPDADQVGKDHMDEVAGIVGRLALAQRRIDPEIIGLEEKEDAVEWLERFGGDEPAQTLFRMLTDASESLCPSSSLMERIQAAIDGKRTAIEWVHKQLSNLTRALVPGSVVMLGGNAGAAKSLLVMQNLLYWTEQGIKAAVFEVEDDQAFHLERALAQVTKQSKLTTSKWQQENPTLAMKLYLAHKELMDKMAQVIWESPDGVDITLDYLANWADERAKDGCRIIVIDPITLASTSKERWVADQSFLMKIKLTARNYGASIILVTHPKTGQAGRGGGMDDMAGGAVYVRASHCILWLKHLEDPETITVKDPMGFTTQVIADKRIEIRKARSGRGAGCRIMYAFDGDSLTYKELGLPTT